MITMVHTSSHNNARHASPKIHETFATSYAHRALDHALVDRASRRVYDLHSRLRIRVRSVRSRKELGRSVCYANISHLYSVDRVHDSMFLRKWSAPGGTPTQQLRICSGHHTAIPAKAPAVMFWTREKLGGRAS